MPRKMTPCSYLVKIPVIVAPEARKLAGSGRRLDVAGSWDGTWFTVSGAGLARNQHEPSYTGTPPRRGEFITWPQGRALEQSCPPKAMEDLVGATSMPAGRNDPASGATHLSLEVAYVNEELAEWRTVHPLGGFVLFRATIGATDEWLFD